MFPFALWHQVSYASVSEDREIFLTSSQTIILKLSLPKVKSKPMQSTPTRCSFPDKGLLCEIKESSPDSDFGLYLSMLTSYNSDKFEPIHLQGYRDTPAQSRRI